MKAVIFDFDGTLADSSQCGLLATQEAFAACGLTVPTKEQIDYYMGIPIEQSFLEMADQPLQQAIFDELLQTFREAYKRFERTTLQLFPSIEQTLAHLKQNGLLLFVVSSKKSDVLHRNLQHLHIDSFFTDWIGSDQVTAYKPAPEGVEIILARYSLQSSDCVVVGDAIFDIQMGKAANCHTIEALREEAPNFIATTPQEITSFI